MSSEMPAPDDLPTQDSSTVAPKWRRYPLGGSYGYKSLEILRNPVEMRGSTALGPEISIGISLILFATETKYPDIGS